MPCPNCSCTSCLPVADLLVISTKFPPPPSELITTNRAPTDSEVGYSRAIINSAGETVSILQAVVDGLLGLITQHKAAVSPLKSFPPELLVEIFAQSAAIAPDDWRYPPPLVLMWVCSRWRRIVLDAPKLWTKIFFEASPND
ncbi:hypothetical protein BD779DRAFT_1570991 [Infundibulicybe gibba]|nr:hypothetical protein BD779DRAFT_1570991 [Infundibulicybe gibba]